LKWWDHWSRVQKSAVFKHIFLVSMFLFAEAQGVKVTGRNSAPCAFQSYKSLLYCQRFKG
jgi:hypothetical protein